MAVTLNVIGGGRAGRTLSRVFALNGIFEAGDVLDRTLEIAAGAVTFIGSGRAAGAFADMRPAAVWMLTPPDDQIIACGEALAASGLLRTGDIVFHISGASPSRDLAAVLTPGVRVASVHPLRSFADPAVAAQTFAGTYCAAEGDAAALAVLTPAFEAAGARVSAIDPDFKTIYHAASVIVSNYLAALMEAGLRSYEKSGLERGRALRMMEPLVRETLDNVFRLGTVEALTGPIARGDYAVVKSQEAALGEWSRNVADAYRSLGLIAAELSQAQGKADPIALEEIARLLKRNH